MFYENVIAALNRKRVDYVVAGGVALVLHGVVRLTADLDLVVNLREENLARFVETMTELGYKPRVPVKAADLIDPSTRKQWETEKNMKVFSFYHPKSHLLVDIFINEPVDYAGLIKRSITVRAGNLKIPVVSVKDLIKLKSISARPQDMADIAALKEVQKLGRK